MSEASVGHTNVGFRLWRASFLVVGVFAFLLLAPKPAHADGILGPATDAVERVTSTTGQTVEQVSAAVDDVSSTATASVDEVDQTVASTVGTVTQVAADATGTVGEVAADAIGAVGAAVSGAADTATGAGQQALAQVAQPSTTPVAGDGDGVVPDAPGGSAPPAPVPPIPAEPAQPPNPAPHAHHHGPAPGARIAVQSSSGYSEVAPTSGGSTVASSPSQRLPATPWNGVAGAAAPAGDGSRDPGGRGPIQLVAILVAALVLAGASSRWLRLFAVARAPNPFIPILTSPG